MLHNKIYSGMGERVTQGSSFFTSSRRDCRRDMKCVEFSMPLGILVNVTDQKNLQMALTISAEMSDVS